MSEYTLVTFVPPLVVAVLCPKGGTGKSTVALNLGHAAAKRGYKVCVVDTDFKNPNNARYAFADTGLSLNGYGLGEDEFLDASNVDFNGRSSLIDVVLGKKIFSQKGGRLLKRKPKPVFERKHLKEVGIKSERNPRLTYAFMESLVGKNLEDRGSREERRDAMYKAHELILKQARDLKEYEFVILDFPSGFPSDSDEDLRVYCGCDRRVHVTDNENPVSSGGIEDIAMLLAKRKINPDHNFVVINGIPEEWKDKTMQELVDCTHRLVRPFIAGIFNSIYDGGYGKYRQHAETQHTRLLEKLRESSLPGFSEFATYLFEERGVKESSRMGVPFLADRERKGVYAVQMDNLVEYLINPRFGKGEKQ